MPFKRVNNKIYKLVDGKWVTKATAKSEKNAAIMMNILKKWQSQHEQVRSDLDGVTFSRKPYTDEKLPTLCFILKQIEKYKDCKKHNEKDIK